jgi:GNAT superfamily N-acetyltransferase
VREAQAEDAAGINRLFERAMGVKRSLEHDRWKFWQNPFGSPYIMLAEDEGEIVGQYALWPLPILLGPEVVKGAQSLDTMTHPDYQGQGMFTTLAAACYDLAASRGAEVLYGFPNASSYPGFVRRLNWHHTGGIARWLRALHPSDHPRIPTLLKPFANAAAMLLPVGRTRGLQLERTRPPAADLTEFLKTHPPEKDTCAPHRNPEWYAWRFEEAAGHDYTWICAWEKGKLQGWVVWGRDRSVQYPQGLVSDLMGDDRSVLEALVAAVVRDARKSGIAILTAVTNIPRFVRALQRSGFITRTNERLIVRGMTARTLGGNIHTHAGWRIFGADADTF